MKDVEKEYEVFKDNIYLDKNGNPLEKTWANYFIFRDKDYCGYDCEFNNLDEQIEDFKKI